jgi:hypothetical protein
MTNTNKSYRLNSSYTASITAIIIIINSSSSIVTIIAKTELSQNVKRNYWPFEMRRLVLHLLTLTRLLSHPVMFDHVALAHSHRTLRKSDGSQSLYCHVQNRQKKIDGSVE